MGEHDALFYFLDGLQVMGQDGVEDARDARPPIGDCYHLVTHQVQEGVLKVTVQEDPR